MMELLAIIVCIAWFRWLKHKERIAGKEAQGE